jgi:hypothetical protein
MFEVMDRQAKDYPGRHAVYALIIMVNVINFD